MYVVKVKERHNLKIEYSTWVTNNTYWYFLWLSKFLYAKARTVTTSFIHSSMQPIKLQTHF